MCRLSHYISFLWNRRYPARLHLTTIARKCFAMFSNCVIKYEAGKWEIAVTWTRNFPLWSPRFLITYMKHFTNFQCWDIAFYKTPPPLPSRPTSLTHTHVETRSDKRLRAHETLRIMQQNFFQLQFALAQYDTNPAYSRNFQLKFKSLSGE